MGSGFRDELQKIHDHFSNEEIWDNYSLEFEIYKKLMLNFQPGPSFYWVLNVKTAAFEIISPEIENVLGYKQDAFSFLFMLDCIHEDDKPYILNFEIAIANFFREMHFTKRFEYKLQYDYRIMTAQGDYVRILNQMMIIKYDVNEKYILTLGINSDITYMQKNTRPMLCFVSLNNEPSFYDVTVEAVFKPSKEVLTKKEKEILRLLAKGKISKEISLLLNVSKLTVDCHRRNMLYKTSSKSTSELINIAVINGWI